MHLRKFPAPVTREDLEAITAFLPIFERMAPNDFMHCEAPTKRDDGSFLAVHAVYNPQVEAWIDACKEHGFFQQFKYGAWSDEAQGYEASPSLVASADLATCIKLITSHIRAERFCEGHLGDVLGSGFITAILHRLGELAKDLDHQLELLRRESAPGTATHRVSPLEAGLGQANKIKEKTTNVTFDKVFDLSVDLRATPGMFRVVKVDTYDSDFVTGRSYRVGDYMTLEEARAKAMQLSIGSEVCYVYDDKGELMYEAGSKPSPTRLRRP